MAGTSVSGARLAPLPTQIDRAPSQLRGMSSPAPTMTELFNQKTQHKTELTELQKEAKELGLQSLKQKKETRTHSTKAKIASFRAQLDKSKKKHNIGKTYQARSKTFMQKMGANKFTRALRALFSFPLSKIGSALGTGLRWTGHIGVAATQGVFAAFGTIPGGIPLLLGLAAEGVAKLGGFEIKENKVLNFALECYKPAIALTKDHISIKEFGQNWQNKNEEFFHLKPSEKGKSRISSKFSKAQTGVSTSVKIAKFTLLLGKGATAPLFLLMSGAVAASSSLSDFKEGSRLQDRREAVKEWQAQHIETPIETKIQIATLEHKITQDGLAIQSTDRANRKKAIEAA